MRRSLLYLFLLTACTHIPEHDLGEMAVSANCDSIAADFAVGDWPDEAWWEKFNDPILTNLIEEALQSSPTLMRAASKLKAASQKALEKKATLYPEISFDPSDSWQHYSQNGFFRTYAPTVPAMVNDIMINLTFGYEFDFWGKNRDLFHAELGEERARAAEVKQAELIVTTSIAYTYIELQYLLFKKELLDRQGEIREEILGIRAQRERHALDTSLVQLSSQSDHLDIKALLREVEPQIRQHIHRIKSLTGLGQDAPLDIPLKPINPLLAAVPNHLSLDLLARRPDLAALKSRVEASAKRISAAKTDFYPNVNLAAFVGLESIFWNKIFNAKTYSANMTPAIHLPIFTAGRLRAQLMEKAADFNDAVFAYNELILQAAQEVADTVTAIAFLQKEIAVRQHSLEVAERQKRLTLKRMEHAIDDRVAYLSAEYAAIEAKLALVALEYGKQLEGILLIRSLGGGYNDCS